MEQHIDQPLSVDQLTPEDLIAAARAVATIVALNHAGAPAPGQVPFFLTVRWSELASYSIDEWLIALTDATVALDAMASAEAETLLYPIVQAMRPRAVKYSQRSWWDDATPEERDKLLADAGMAMHMTGEPFEPRWVADTTVLRVSPEIGTGDRAQEEAWALLADIGARLGLTERNGVRTMEQRIDRPLSVKRLTPAAMIAAAQAVVTIIAINHADAAWAGRESFDLVVEWHDQPAGERWDISLSNVNMPVNRAAAVAEAERLLQPILQAVQPRAVKHFFRSQWDEATLEDLNNIGNAGVLPGPSAYEKRWVVDRTVLRVSPVTGAGREGLEKARAVLMDISDRLGITCAESAPLGFIGMSLDDATKTDLFEWFHFAPAASPAAGQAVFKPSGEKFHDLATLSAAVGADGRITAIDVAIARSFIDDPRDGIFAADLGKSFLAAALPPDDRTAMQHLIDTIGYGGNFGRTVITAAPGPANLQIVRDSAPYLVWLDRNEYWQRPMGAVSLRLENTRLDGTAVLRITVGAKTTDSK